MSAPGAFLRAARRPVVFSGLCVLGVAVLACALAPILPLADPNATALDARLLAPLSPGHVLGTDQLGRDLLARLIYGTRLSLLVALAGVAVAAVLGTAAGDAQRLPRPLDGHRGDAQHRRIDGVSLSAAWPLPSSPRWVPGLGNATLAIAIVNIPFFARSVRGATLSIVEEEYVAAARATGATSTRVMTRHVLPNVMPVVIVACSTSIGWMIVETAGLSFLGLGAQPPAADLGGLLGQSRHLVATAPHVALVPGVAILAVVIALNLVGDGLRQSLDPKLQQTE